MSPADRASLEELLERPVDRPAADVTSALESGPMDPALALDRTELDRMLDPAAEAAETGWCVLEDGVSYVAVRTPMPDVTGEMVDWWFDWHPRHPIRYRIWHPTAHFSNSFDPPPAPRAKPHWGAVHHPVEDVGLGVVHARIAFCAPSELGFATDALDDENVATVVCGYAGDDRRRMRHSPMVHAFLREGNGVVLRSRFWLGAALRPYLPEPLAAIGGRALNNGPVRRAVLPKRLPRALATHCAEEYANLAALLPGLYARFS